MIRNRILSLLVCAALLACLLAGCSTSSGTNGGEAASSSSSAASSESIPSSTTQANTGKLTPNLDESDNSIFSPASTQDAFAPCLGWGPGVSGCSLKSVIAADSLLSWAENGNLAMQTTDVIEDAYTEWYDSLSTDEQDSFADAWPLIKEDANALLTDTSSMTGRIEDAGLNAKELPDCSEENWQALQDVIGALVRHPANIKSSKQNEPRRNAVARLRYLRLFSGCTGGCPCRFFRPVPASPSTRCSGWNP